MRENNHCKEHGVNYCSTCADRLFAVSQFAAFIQKEKEPMAKTKKIETSAFAVFPKYKAPSLRVRDVEFWDEEQAVDKDYLCVPFKITFEIPVEEPSVKVTPSMIREIWSASPGDPNKSFLNDLNMKLFGKEWA